MSEGNVPTAAEIREEIAWAGTGPWTEINDEVEAQVEARGQAFDRWLAEHDRKLQDERDGLAAQVQAIRDAKRSERVDDARDGIYGIHVNTWYDMDALEDALAQSPGDALAAHDAAILADAGRVIHVSHYDIEKHAESFNEGYEAAVTQGLADDPTLASDWLAAHDAKVWDEGAIFGWHTDGDLRPSDNPYRASRADDTNGDSA